MDVITLTAIAVGTQGDDLSPPLSGLIHKVRLVYANNPGAQSDVTLRAVDDPAGEWIVSRQNIASNVTLYPRRVVHDALGNPLTLDGVRPLCEPYAVHGQLRLSLQDANPGGQCTAWVWLVRV
ncbi:MAG: hypothetical protein NZ840_11650 [Anaerolineales bacterium]|nr:hypothetical protein [Anaerolineales bacterium]MDW8162689.1 hypothetical protein [Anaerolineales bacterium]